MLSSATKPPVAEDADRDRCSVDVPADPIEFILWYRSPYVWHVERETVDRPGE
jgi:hypothetical protein